MSEDKNLAKETAKPNLAQMALAKLTGLEGQVKSLLAENEALRAKARDLEAENAQLRESLKAAQEQAQGCEELRAALSDAEAKAKTLEGEAKSAEERAAKIVAGLGVDEAALPAASESPTYANKLEEYNALKEQDPAKAKEFFAKNRLAILDEATQGI